MRLFNINRESAAASPADPQPNPPHIEMGAEPADAPADDMERLQQSRDDILAELDRLARVDHAVADAEKALAALDDEAAEIERREREAWQVWATTAEGPSPSARTADREELAHRRVLAACDLGGARVGQAAIEARRAALNSELRDLGEQIFAANAAKLVAEAAQANHAAIGLAADLIERSAVFDSTRLCLMAVREDAVKAGNQERAAALTRFVDAIEALPRATLMGDANALDRRIAEIKHHLAG